MMELNFDTMEDIFDNESMVKFTKPNRTKTRYNGQVKSDSPWYNDKLPHDALTKNLDKILGILRKNIGKDFGKTCTEIINKCARSAYDKYVIKDYLNDYIYSKAESTKYRYLRDIFYVDNDGKLQYRAKAKYTYKQKDSEYAYFHTPEDKKIYKYYLRYNDINIFRIKQIFLVGTGRFIEDFFGKDWEDRTFTVLEVMKFSKELSYLSKSIKKFDEATYNIMTLLHPEFKSHDAELVREYLFHNSCVNPYIVVKKNTPEYWKLRKQLKKTR